MRESNGSFDSCNSCSRLHELDESKLPFVSRIEFIRSKFRFFLLMYPGSVTESESGDEGRQRALSVFGRPAAGPRRSFSSF